MPSPNCSAMPPCGSPCHERRSASCSASAPSMSRRPGCRQFSEMSGRHKAMADGAVWQPLVSELDRWRQSGRRAALWLRDDDAVEPTAALDRLLHATSRCAIQATLAVIPAYAGEPLAARLTAEPRISVAVHGWAHDNYAQPSEKKQELGPHREAELVLGELSRAKAVIDRQFGGQAVPVLVPP